MFLPIFRLRLNFFPAPFVNDCKKKRKTRDTLKTKEKWCCCYECKRSATTSTWSFFLLWCLQDVSWSFATPSTTKVCDHVLPTAKKTVHTKNVPFTSSCVIFWANFFSFFSNLIFIFFFLFFSQIFKLCMICVCVCVCV